jgi:hypothetical protein
MFIALGGLGILHVLDILNWGNVVGEWWPVAIIGWALAEMLTARRFSATAAVIAAIGVGLLADEQDRTGSGVVWSAVFIAIGMAILYGHSHRTNPSTRPSNGRGGGAEAVGNGARQAT